MEELLKNIFIRETLPQQFDSSFWKIISEEPPSKFQAKQIMLYNSLLKDASLKDQYFQKFQKNHLRIYQWYLLAIREKVEIQPYLFRPLLQHTPCIRQKKTKKPHHPGYPHRSSRTQPNQIHKILLTPAKHKQKMKTICEEEISSHDLYMQTFAACGGERYVPYDYSRHMKSRMQRAHYNTYIRKNHKRNQSSPNHSENSLSKFIEWGQMKEKISLLSFRGILGNLGLNSQRGLQNMLKRKGSKKLVFVNHQRKPVNYYLRQEVDREQN